MSDCAVIPADLTHTSPIGRAPSQEPTNTEVTSASTWALLETETVRHRQRRCGETYLVALNDGTGPMASHNVLGQVGSLAAGGRHPNWFGGRLRQARTQLTAVAGGRQGRKLVADGSGTTNATECTARVTATYRPHAVWFASGVPAVRN